MKLTEGEERQSLLERLAALIVDKRKAFYLIYMGLAVFCVFSSGWVSVNDELTSYLPEDTETRQGLTVMEDQFVTFGTNRILADNLPYDQASELAERLEQVPGVKSVEFDNTPDHYQTGAALFTVTYEGTAEDPVSLEALDRVKVLLDEYDLYVTGDTGVSESASLAREMVVVMAVAVVIILLVLVFTSQTWMEIPVLLLTFGMAALLNMGTNYLLGEISYISNSVAVVLQLALAIDYAIILCHRYTEERASHQPREAVVTALSKAIPEISGSSLTTLSGLGAMCFMKFGIGRDLGVVLMKAIVLSLLSVFTLMPGLLMSFSGMIDRSHHRNFVPKITALGKFAVKTRFLMPPVFAAVLAAAFVCSNRCPYVYGMSTLTTFAQNESRAAQEKVDGLFGRENRLAALVPAGDYQKEGRLLRALEGMEGVESAMGLANIEAMDGYVLTDRLTPRQFAELADLDVEAARLLYSAYAVDQESYGQLISGLDGYGVPLLDMFLFVHEQMDKGYITLDADTTEKLDDLYGQLLDAKKQLGGADYSRFVVNLSLPEESGETFAFLEEAKRTVERYYPEGALLVGNSTSDRDLSESFGKDNVLISILTIVFVILVLVFTFQSAGLPVLLILVIQGSVWINFSFPYLTGTNLFFLSYLVVSSIQMGANIDYAIVIANRYTELKTTMKPKEAVVEALNEAFPTIVTSGTILASAGILIGFLSSNPSIASIGVCLGRGTLISIFLVLCILPQILLLGDTLIEKTAFAIHPRLKLERHAGTLLVDGRIRGYVSGVVDAEFNGLLRGTIDASVSGGTVTVARADGHPMQQPQFAEEPVPTAENFPAAETVPPVEQVPPVGSVSPVEQVPPVTEQVPQTETVPPVTGYPPVQPFVPAPEPVPEPSVPAAEPVPQPPAPATPEPVPEEPAAQTVPAPETPPAVDSALEWERRAGFTGQWADDWDMSESEEEDRAAKWERMAGFAEHFAPKRNYGPEEPVKETSAVTPAAEEPVPLAEPVTEEPVPLAEPVTEEPAPAEEPATEEPAKAAEPIQPEQPADALSAEAEPMGEEATGYETERR